MVFLQEGGSQQEPPSMLSFSHDQQASPHMASSRLFSLFVYNVLAFENQLIYIFPRRQITQGYQVPCTPTEYQILLYLLTHPEQVISFHQFLITILLPDATTYDEQDILALQKHMSRLKRKLPSFLKIMVVRGYGYILRYEGRRHVRGNKHSPRQRPR